MSAAQTGRPFSVPDRVRRIALRGRRRAALLRARLRQPGAARRAVPDFLIIGAMRAGTTSLFDAVSRHPGVLGPLRKETHYFDEFPERDVSWYRAHFPTRAALGRAARTQGASATGEATPYYLFHPAVPKRVRRALPDVRLIAILRDPVARAVSHYHHACRMGFESLPLERALDLEPERLRGEERQLLDDPSYRSHSHQHHSYVARGRYVEQLERWLARFPRERLLVVTLERFRDDPAATLRKVQRFIGLDEAIAPAPARYNRGGYGRTPERLVQRLRREFEEPNRRLAELLGEDHGW